MADQLCFKEAIAKPGETGIAVYIQLIKEIVGIEQLANIGKTAIGAEQELGIRAVIITEQPRSIGKTKAASAVDKIELTQEVEDKAARLAVATDNVVNGLTTKTIDQIGLICARQNL